MTASEAFLVGLGGALAVWLIKIVITTLLRRKALSDALIFDLRERRQRLSDDCNFLETLVESKLELGKAVPYTARFTFNEPHLFRTSMPEVIAYMPDRFTSVATTYSAFVDANHLISGLVDDLTTLMRQRTQLNREDIKMLRARKDRVCSYRDAMNATSFSDLKELPRDYEVLKGAGEVVDDGQDMAIRNRALIEGVGTEVVSDTPKLQ